MISSYLDAGYDAVTEDRQNASTHQGIESSSLQVTESIQVSCTEESVPKIHSVRSVACEKMESGPRPKWR